LKSAILHCYPSVFNANLRKNKEKTRNLYIFFDLDQIESITAGSDRLALLA
jgi:hypothetical protein